MCEGISPQLLKNNDLSNTPNGNVIHPQEIKTDGNRYFSNNIKNPHAIRREVSFRQQCNSSGEKRHPHNMVQSSGKQTPTSINNVTSVERARARALQAVNYYNSSVLGDPTMEPPPQFAGKKNFLDSAISIGN